MTDARILIITGLAREAAILRGALPRAAAARRPFRVVCAGPGAERAQAAFHRAARAAEADGPRVRLCLSIGFAAGLIPALEAGEIVLPAEIVSASERWSCARIPEAIADPPLVRVARLAEAPAPLAGPREKAGLHLETGAVAADMESAALARLCAQAGIAFAALRVISDAAAHLLPRTVTAAVDDAGRLDPWKLAAGLLVRPADWGPFLRLARAGMRAEAALGRLGAALPQIALPFLI